ncbi:Lipopolysaccharide biosynthesis regulator YciM, contains six TPR domains and a predicted metal-binding C-terminal domain [Andreprevotia lacus DSM 23236]|jgi:lipopolysaccharide biosynthesis regulator YciM|uniref:Lipopolysaccharide assembly protein B n=1 Tax=Andreprevotia lacus DSM 23236 TaxID=1121001 RepID=A0A1W1XHT4_9NEIS|nr:lipopolysaccharide assembly protein LapB [Andreprevotia lacus]SMC23553.1 Lipopolysaccharide biosynthesis regulator YciM, contains six TPR domains and a predicted metal-binding C-terminal domain [Andreprevotia lacus DSM 23236]
MPDTQFWWLIAFPIFFGLGWLAARVDIKHVLSETRSLPASYFKGLNFLLNGETNRAVEVYVDIARHHAETVELQFTLGHLFRRRGELERAIRMHQKLLARRDLADTQRQQAQFELAQDFMKAGLFDRAEAILTELANTDYARQARTELLAVYQQEKDWHKAIETARQLRDDSHNYQHEIAQFYCELAVQAHTRSHTDEARAYLQQALEANRQCARARLLLADIADAAGDKQGAIEQWLLLENQDPLYLALAARALLNAYDALEQHEQGLTLLLRLLQQYPELDVLDLAYERILAQQGLDAAYAFVRERMKTHPTMPSLRKVLEAHMLVAPDDQKVELEIIVKLLNDTTREQSMYFCNHCGFKAKQYFWHCPACTEWEVFAPVRGRKNRLHQTESY